jgi:putative spermidine/putrescine transport system permease protein
VRRGPSGVALWSGAVYAFVLAPLAVVLVASLTAAEYTSFPPEGLSLRWYVAIASHPEFVESLRVSLGVALVTGVLATALGTLAALALARHRFPGRDLLNTLFLSPLMVPTVILGVALLNFYTVAGITRTPFSLVFGHLVITVPYVVRLVSASLAGLDRTLEQAAMNLGASPWQAFRRVTLPLARPGIVAGAAFATITSFDDVSVALFLASPHSMTLPVRIFTYIEQTFDPLVTAVCSLLIVLAAVAVAIIERTIGLGRLFGTDVAR